MIQAIDICIFCLISGTIGLVGKTGKRFQNVRKEDLPKRWSVRRDSLISTDQTNNKFVRFDRSLQRILIRGGVPLDSSTFLLLLVCVSLAAAGTAIVFGLHIVLQFIILIAAFMTGLIGVYLKMIHRMNQFAKGFPASLELLARSTRAGNQLESAFEIAARSSDEPVKSEFLQCVKQLNLGLGPQVVVDDLAKRIDSVEVHLFSHTISIHHRMGGRLAESLERLSSTIRDRSQCEEKIKSMTSIGRYSVIGIVLMGAFVLSYMLIAELDYIDNLFTSSLGQKLLVYAAISELVGLVWVGMTLKSDL